MHAYMQMQTETQWKWQPCLQKQQQWGFFLAKKPEELKIVALKSYCHMEHTNNTEGISWILEENLKIDSWSVIPAFN